jgi:hypothetical protein
MLKHIKVIPFLAGLVIGIIAIMFINPEKTIVFKYPTPENCGKVTYKDKNGVCYKYSSKEVDCDKNESRLKDFPLNK